MKNMYANERVSLDYYRALRGNHVYFMATQLKSYDPRDNWLVPERTSSSPPIRHKTKTKRVLFTASSLSCASRWVTFSIFGFLLAPSDCFLFSAWPLCYSLTLTWNALYDAGFWRLDLISLFKKLIFVYPKRSHLRASGVWEINTL